MCYDTWAMKVKDFYYELPKELIAQDPLTDRSSSRLMVVDRHTGEIRHDIFKNITDYLKPSDCLVINDTKVIPARLFGTRTDTHAVIEILLLTRRSDTDWECLVKPGKRPAPDAGFYLVLLKREMQNLRERSSMFFPTETV